MGNSDLLVLDSANTFEADQFPAMLEHLVSSIYVSIEYDIEIQCPGACHVDGTATFT